MYIYICVHGELLAIEWPLYGRLFQCVMNKLILQIFHHFRANSARLAWLSERRISALVCLNSLPLRRFFSRFRVNGLYVGASLINIYIYIYVVVYAIYYMCRILIDIYIFIYFQLKHLHLFKCFWLRILYTGIGPANGLYKYITFFIDEE